jgi:hypothetical protein
MLSGNEGIDYSLLFEKITPESSKKIDPKCERHNSRQPSRRYDSKVHQDEDFFDCMSSDDEFYDADDSHRCPKSRDSLRANKSVENMLPTSGPNSTRTDDTNKTHSGSDFELSRLTISLSKVRIFSATQPSLEGEHQKSINSSLCDYDEACMECVVSDGLVYRELSSLDFADEHFHLTTPSVANEDRFRIMDTSKSFRNECQRRHRRIERMKMMKWTQIMTECDLGLVIDSGLGRPRTLLCSPQPAHREQTEGGFVNNGMNCPHFDVSMAQYYLGLSAWFDNMQESPEFVDIAQDTSVKMSNQPDFETAEEWGYWFEPFASPAFKENWRALRFSHEFCIFMPAIRVDASMNIGYFPDPPKSLAAFLKVYIYYSNV